VLACALCGSVSITIGESKRHPRLFAERIAFFVNIYNALIIHGTCEFGSPANLLKRLTFFGDACYRIGADTYSANDIEHGVLRNNATSPASAGALLGFGPLKKPQFKSGDRRRAQCVEPMDPRIHFALVCGAKSCPPIKLYTPDNLNEGLQVRRVRARGHVRAVLRLQGAGVLVGVKCTHIHLNVMQQLCNPFRGESRCTQKGRTATSNICSSVQEAATAFCSGEVEIDQATRTVTMSKIFKWYGADFAEEPKARLLKIAEFCQGSERAALEELAKSDGKVHLKYNNYDWTSNSK
jgi:Protein of unknown function, DUF547